MVSDSLAILLLVLHVTSAQSNNNSSTFDYLDEDYFEYIYPKTWTWALICLHFLVFLVGLIGNCLVCLAVYRNQSMRTVTNYFIVNLAIADFLVILFCLPPSVVWDVTSTWWFGTLICKIVLYIQSVSVTVSILTLTFISLDRWYAICLPLKFKSTTGRAKKAMAFLWLFSLISEIPEAIYLRASAHPSIPEKKVFFTQCTPTWSRQTDTIFMATKMLFFYFFPLILITLAYVQIARVLWRQTSEQQEGPFSLNTNTTTEMQLKSRKKAAKMLVCVVIMFAFCFFPVHLLAILRLTVNLSNSEENRAFSLISHWLCYANSAINPIIYNFMSIKFRREFRKTFEFCGQKSPKNEYQMTSLRNKHSTLLHRRNTKSSILLD